MLLYWGSPRRPLSLFLRYRLGRPGAGFIVGGINVDRLFPRGTLFTTRTTDLISDRRVYRQETIGTGFAQSSRASIPRGSRECAVSVRDSGELVILLVVVVGRRSRTRTGWGRGIGIVGSIIRWGMFIGTRNRSDSRCSEEQTAIMRIKNLEY